MTVRRTLFALLLFMASISIKSSHLVAAGTDELSSLDIENMSFHGRNSFLARLDTHNRHHSHHHRHHHHRHHGHHGHHGHRHFLTCNKSPHICRAEGSPGQSCCRNKCVDLMNDSLNCGRCGGRCSFGQTCCGGKCIEVMNDNWNCGGCNNKCGNGSYCKLGMCGYA